MTKKTTAPVVVDNGTGLPVPLDHVRQSVNVALLQHPCLVSYDPTTAEGEVRSLQVEIDPGVPAQMRDGWIGRVIEWGVSVGESADQKTGEVSRYPTLLLIADNGEACRLAGWPIISVWARVVERLGVERVRRGLLIRIKRQPSQTPGRSYWSITPVTQKEALNG